MVEHKKTKTVLSTLLSYRLPDDVRVSISITTLFNKAHIGSRLTLLVFYGLVIVGFFELNIFISFGDGGQTHQALPNLVYGSGGFAMLHRRVSASTLR